MIIAGKCPPEKEELEAAKNRGFENVELYLERKHIDNYHESLRNCRNTDVNIVSVHTPHAYPDEDGYFEGAGHLAKELDAKLVFHSKYVHHYNIPDLEEMNIASEYGYENNPGVSVFALENLILGRGHKLVLDTAHLFIGEEDFVSALKHFVNHRASKIQVIHLCDSTYTQDGLGFGEGDIDMKKTSRIISKSKYDGILVLEVMPEHQKDALEKFTEWTQ